MTERPILFSGPMVRAILDGRKTQTRRVLKPQPPAGITRLLGPAVYRPVAFDYRGNEIEGAPIFGVFDEDGEFGTALRFQPGDRLWVRETWTHTGDGVWTIANARMALSGSVRYRADGPIAGAKYWPSIHMPREFSRITLEVTDVKVERLQDISEANARREGLEQQVRLMPEYRGAEGLPWRPEFPRDAFADLWNSINGPGSWEANPWVVAIAFKRVTP